MSQAPKILFRRPYEKQPGDIDLTSRSTENWSRDLSPFLLGPCYTPKGDKSETFENLYQYSKVYPQHADPSGKPNADWYTWRAKGFAKKWADRHPMPRGSKPLHCQWGSRRLDYIAARKEVYAPVYYDLVKNHPSLQRLRDIFEIKTLRGEKLILVDFDVYDPGDATYEEIINNPDRICGHGFIVAMILENQRVWEDALPTEPAPENDEFSAFNIKF